MYSNETNSGKNVDKYNNSSIPWVVNSFCVFIASFVEEWISILKEVDRERINEERHSIVFRLSNNMTLKASLHSRLLYVAIARAICRTLNVKAHTKWHLAFTISSFYTASHRKQEAAVFTRNKLDLTSCNKWTVEEFLLGLTKFEQWSNKPLRDALLSLPIPTWGHIHIPSNTVTYINKNSCQHVTISSTKRVGSITTCSFYLHKRDCIWIMVPLPLLL